MAESDFWTVFAYFTENIAKLSLFREKVIKKVIFSRKYRFFREIVTFLRFLRYFVDF
jgi:hypothetical protein